MIGARLTSGVKKRGLEIEFNHVANDLVSYTCPMKPITLDTEASWNFQVGGHIGVLGGECAPILGGEGIETAFPSEPHPFCILDNKMQPSV